MWNLFKILAFINLGINVYGIPLHQSCGKSLNTTSPNWRIMDGTDAKVGEFPWHSLMDLIIEDPDRRDANNFCGGTIINEQWVLTAGHCVKWSEPKTLKIRFGVHSFTNKPDNHEVDVNVDKVIIHEDFVFGNNVSNDIALIKLEKSLDFEKYKQLIPICLAKNDTKLTSRCIVTGFGIINETGNLRPKNRLQKTDEPLIDPSACKKEFPGIFNEKQQVCAGKGGHGVCYLDSGGPLQCQGEDSRWYQVGIVSYGVTPCARTGKIDAYMKVSAYFDWIQTHMKNN